MFIPINPDNPKYDILMGEIGKRTHYIHQAMAASPTAKTPGDIGKDAEMLAVASGYVPNGKTFSAQITRCHLISMRDKPGRGFAEILDDGRWQLTPRARALITAAI